MKHNRRVHSAIALVLALAALVGGPASARAGIGVGGTPTAAVGPIATAGIAARSYGLQAPRADTTSTATGGKASFHWDDAGIGAAMMLALVALVAGATIARPGRRGGTTRRDLAV